MAQGKRLEQEDAMSATREENVATDLTGEQSLALDREEARRELARAAAAGDVTLGEYAERAPAVEQPRQRHRDSGRCRADRGAGCVSSAIRLLVARRQR